MQRRVEGKLMKELRSALQLFAAVLYRKACATSVALLCTGPPRLVGFPWDPLCGLAGNMRRPEAAVSLANSGPHRSPPRLVPLCWLSHPAPVLSALGRKSPHPWTPLPPQVQGSERKMPGCGCGWVKSVASLAFRVRRNGPQLGRTPFSVPHRAFF